MMKTFSLNSFTSYIVLAVLLIKYITQAWITLLSPESVWENRIFALFNFTKLLSLFQCMLNFEVLSILVFQQYLEQLSTTNLKSAVLLLLRLSLNKQPELFEGHLSAPSSSSLSRWLVYYNDQSLQEVINLKTLHSQIGSCFLWLMPDYLPGDA